MPSRAVSGFVRVLPCGDLPALEGLESQIRCVPVGRQMVLLGRLQCGEVVAFAASCPHELTDLRQATFVEGKVRCPKHNYLYDPHTGANVIPAEITRPENLWKLRPGYLPTYRTEERDGWVWVSERPNPAPASWDRATEERPPGLRGVRTAVVLPPEEEPDGPVPPVEHPAERLQVTVGGEFEVGLPTAPMPAFTWRIEVPSAIVAVVEQSFDPGASPPAHRVRLRAHQPGEGTLRCSYRRPWDAEPVEIRTFSVHVEPQ
ncbi:MAG: Rieske 2Fe-2S domain-containing protein [Actinomycetota bacterium]|nr:Rieske 2Fe-2S domain-containing protein [Actinomycetota bacterium]MDQ6946304.1 Rieske 2Fe-2S domain-containing protein [Actinomycetota bacterium]